MLCLVSATCLDGAIHREFNDFLFIFKVAVIKEDSNPSCFNTNYKGSISDFYNDPSTKTEPMPKGVSWNFQPVTFGFEWEDFDDYETEFKRLVFSGHDNLDYFAILCTFKNSSQLASSVSIRPRS